MNDHFENIKCTCGNVLRDPLMKLTGNDAFHIWREKDILWVSCKDCGNTIWTPIVKEEVQEPA